MTVSPICVSDVSLFPLYDSGLPYSSYPDEDSEEEFEESDLPLRTFEEEVEFILGGSMSRSKHWCFTLNNWNTEDVERLAALEGSVDYLVYGKEVGTSGTPHLQGFVSFPDRIRLTTVIQKIGQAHCTVARKIAEAIEYCKKDGVVTEFGTPPRGSGRRNDLDDFKAAVLAGQYCMRTLRRDFSDTVARYPRFCIDFVNDNVPRPAVPAHPLRPWQATLYQDLARSPGDREVIFIVDVTGNTGKSWFCHYYASNHDNAQVLLPGRKQDMTYALETNIRVLFMDAPRSRQGDIIQYDFLEDVKNGYVFSSKYESRAKHLGKVHVVVMMNEGPDESKLSRDRYDIRVVH